MNCRRTFCAFQIFFVERLFKPPRSWEWSISPPPKGRLSWQSSSKRMRGQSRTIRNQSKDRVLAQVYYGTLQRRTGAIPPAWMKASIILTGQPQAARRELTLGRGARSMPQTPSRQPDSLRPPLKGRQVGTMILRPSRAETAIASRTRMFSTASFPGLTSGTPSRMTSAKCSTIRR
jgi:hypothetical protein